MKIILLGAPGSGKGTEGNLISQEFNIPNISTGQIIRENIKNKTELGIKSEDLIKNGNFIPDDMVIELVKQRVASKDCKNGYLLDGFPRTLTQAKVWDKLAKTDIVLHLDVDYDVLKKRILNRSSCALCNQIYSSSTKGKCVKCGGELVRRTDDTEEVLKTRFQIYDEITKPLVDYYEKLGILKTIKGDKPVEEVHKEVKHILEGIKHYDL